MEKHDDHAKALIKINDAVFDNRIKNFNLMNHIFKNLRKPILLKFGITVRLGRLFD